MSSSTSSFSKSDILRRKSVDSYISFRLVTSDKIYEKGYVFFLLTIFYKVVYVSYHVKFAAALNILHMQYEKNTKKELKSYLQKKQNSKPLIWLNCDKQKCSLLWLDSYREKWLLGLALLETDKRRLMGFMGWTFRTGNLEGSRKDMLPSSCDGR